VVGEPAWLWWTIGGAIVILLSAGWWVWSKGRPFSDGHVFRASRLSKGNHLFPTQVLITASTVVQHKPRWVGKEEESIHVAHIASVKIETHLLLSDVMFETSGGSDPILCHGHRKQDAVEMKSLVERAQNDYFRANPGPVGLDPSRR